MLDENLPAFFYKRSPDGLQHNTAIFLSHHGSDPEPAYSLQRPDPSSSPAKNCYAAAIFDSFNPDILYGEVLIKPEWTQPSLSAEEIRRNNGVPPPPYPILPTEFTIQLYNPDQQVTVAMKPGTWGGSAYYEFSLPQTTFRTPSASNLDRTQNDPAASATTPKINFVWRKESKLAKELTCYMTGKSTDTIVKKKHRDPDIAIALYRSLRELTIYEPNLYRVELEDPKGLEITLLLSAAIIKDLYFASTTLNATFNVSDPARASSLANTRRTSSPITHNPHIVGTGPGLVPPLLSLTNNHAAKRKSLPPLQTTPPTASPSASTAAQQRPLPPPPQQDPRTQWEIDAETARLKAQVEAEDRARAQADAARRRERERADEAETRRLRKLFEAEQREANKRQEGIDRETERLRREYGFDGGATASNSQGGGLNVNTAPGRGPRHSAPSLVPISEDGRPSSQHQQQRPQKSQFSRPGPAPVMGSNGLYLQPNSSSYGSSSVVMSGGNGAPSSPEARRMKKKSFFGLRSRSDEGGLDGEAKLRKKGSVMW